MLDHQRWGMDTNIDAHYDDLTTWLAERVLWLDRAIGELQASN
jgi:hypothetical protein